ncbi:TrmB family transcriptional regulator [Streptomyces syringium]|uniref:TrmB family transcriptional regulator n=1 Tax=Streptomyces syringium TaxID=76729 RepID=UPI00343FEBE4
MIEGAELHALGLGEAEERVYEALLSDRAPNAAALADELGMAYGELESVLVRLRDHGFTLPGPPSGPGGGRPLPRPVAPASAIRTLIHRRQAELHLKSAELERLRLSADHIAGRLGAGSTAVGSGVEAVSGAEAITERTAYLLASAEREVVVLDRPPCPGGTATDPLFEALVEALPARGVGVRMAVRRDGLDADRLRTLTALAGRGVRVRTATEVPTRLIAVDGRVTLLPPADTTDPAASALVIGETLLRDALLPLFETVWDRAVPLGATGGDGRVSEHRRELLGLLAAGLKDEAIARRLGVHVHTARRRISGLLDALGADTRFQAGAQATLRGWLER